jgi:crossover junction endodeoxyribonuclease RuvC
MLILGIDPGTATTGFGLVNLTGSVNEVVTWGLIETDKRLPKENRLDLIFEETLKIINLHKPDVFVIEKVFFSSNVKTAIAVGQAQGVMLLAAGKAKVKVEEYAPGTIKKMLTGSGKANKKEVQEHIRKILGARVTAGTVEGGRKWTKTHFDNAADALAIALTHAFKLTEALIPITISPEATDLKIKKISLKDKKHKKA